MLQAMRDTGASVGAVYLLQPDERALRLAVLSGVPREIAAPWARVALDASTPVVDALREHRLVWLGDQEELARRYRRLALVLPYPFTLAAAAITDGDGTQWGGLVLQWPDSHPSELRSQERGGSVSGWFLAVFTARYSGSVPSGSSTARRTKSTSISGTSSSLGKHPMRW